MTEQQVQLPKGWELKTLGDVGQYINGRGFKKAEWSQTGLPIIRIQNLTGTSSELNYFDGEIDDKHVIDNGDLLISWSATLGAYFWNRGKAALNQHIFKVVSKIDKKFHYYLIQNILNDLYRQAHGSGMVHITKAKFESTQVSIPQAEIDQKQIVAKIEELFSHIDAGIESLKTAQEKLKQYRQSVLKAAVTGELTKEWREQNADAEHGSSNVAGDRTSGATKIEPADQLLKRIQSERRNRWEQQKLAEFQAKGKPPKNDKWKEKYQEPETMSDLDAFTVPKSWIVINFDTAIVAGPQNGIYLPKSKYGQGIPIIRIDDYQDGYVKPYSKLQKVDATGKEIQTYGISKNDLIINRVNSMTHIGKCMVVNSKYVPALFESNMMKLSLSSLVNVGYFELFINSKLGRQELTQNAKQAVNQASINQQDVKSTRIGLPPLEEQKEIVQIVEEKLSSADRLMNEIETKLTQVQQQKQTILASAFKGELV